MRIWGTIFQLSGLLVLAVGLWLRFDPGTVELLTGDGAPETFFIGVYDTTNTHTHMINRWYLFNTVSKALVMLKTYVWHMDHHPEGKWKMDGRLDDYRCAAVLLFYKYWSDLPFTVTRKDEQQICFKPDGARPPADNEHRIRKSFAVMQIKLFLLMLNRQHKPPSCSSQ